MKRGLGSPNYDPNRARAVRQAGMRRLRELGKAHRWTPITAAAAGRRGAEHTRQVRAARGEQKEAA